MNKQSRKVVLDSSGLAQLAAGIVCLSVVVFLAGATLGFALQPTDVYAEMELPPSSGEDRSVIAVDGEVESVLSGEVADESTREDGSTITAMLSETQLQDRSPAPFEESFQVERNVRFAVQVGAFGVEANADRMLQRLRGKGYDPLVTAVRNRSGQWMSRVNLSVYDSEAVAVAAAESFSSTEGAPAVVVALWDDGP